MKITKNINIHNGKRTDISLLDLFDDVIKSTFNLNDEEYDFIAASITEEEFGVMLIERPTYQQKRQMLEIRAKYLDLWKANKTS